MRYRTFFSALRLMVQRFSLGFVGLWICDIVLVAKGNSAFSKQWTHTGSEHIYLEQLATTLPREQVQVRFLAQGNFSRGQRDPHRFPVSPGNRSGHKSISLTFKPRLSVYYVFSHTAVFCELFLFLYLEEVNACGCEGLVGVHVYVCFLSSRSVWFVLYQNKQRTYFAFAPASS